MNHLLPGQSENISGNIRESYTGSELLLLVWTQPRKVIRYLTEYEPDKYIIALLALHGISETLHRMMNKHAGDTFGLEGVIGFAVILGPFGGLFSAYFFSSLLSLSGDWLRGKADAAQIRTVMAWSSVPAILLLPVFAIAMILFGAEPFSREQPTMEDHPILTAVIDLVLVVLAAWRVTIFLTGLSQVQQFSVWKAILNCVVAGMIIIIPIVLIISTFAGIGYLLNLA